jgi:hypothetical protein
MKTTKQAITYSATKCSYNDTYNVTETDNRTGEKSIVRTLLTKQEAQKHARTMNA